MSNFKSAALFTAFGFLLAALAGSLRAAPDQTKGMALMSASVDSSGNVYHSAGVASVQPISSGNFEITFLRTLQGCTYVASGSNFNVVVGYDPYEIYPSKSTDNSILVKTFWNGQEIGISFSVIVFCSE